MYRNVHRSPSPNITKLEKNENVINNRNDIEKRNSFPSSVQFSNSVAVVSNSLWSNGLQHARLPWLSSTPGACSNSCLSNQWCHPTFSSSVVPFSSHLQSFPLSGSFPMSQFFASGGQSIRASASASILPMNIHDWFPSEWTGLISLQSKILARVFSSTKFKSINS